MSLDLVLVAVERAIRAKADQDVEELRAYAGRLRDGKPDLTAYPKPTWAYPYVGVLVAAYREETGQRPNPFAPIGYDAPKYHAFDALLTADEPILASDLSKSYFGGGQVEKHLDPYGRLPREHGYRLEKEKVEGKVAYRVVEVVEVEA